MRPARWRGRTAATASWSLSANNRIGGATAAARNLISGNSGTGIRIETAAAAGNLIQRQLHRRERPASGPIGNTDSGIAFDERPLRQHDRRALVHWRWQPDLRQRSTTGIRFVGAASRQHRRCWATASAPTISRPRRFPNGCVMASTSRLARATSSAARLQAPGTSSQATCQNGVSISGAGDRQHRAQQPDRHERQRHERHRRTAQAVSVSSSRRAMPLASPNGGNVISGNT